MRVQLFGEMHFQTLLSLNDYAWFLLRVERHAEGEEISRRAVESARAQVPVDELILHESIVRLGSAHSAQGEYDDAEAVLLDGFGELPDPPPAAHRDEYVEALVQLYESWGNEGEAAGWRELGEELKALDGDGK